MSNIFMPFGEYKLVSLAVYFVYVKRKFEIIIRLLWLFLSPLLPTIPDHKIRFHDITSVSASFLNWFGVEIRTHGLVSIRGGVFVKF